MGGVISQRTVGQNPIPNDHKKTPNGQFFSQNGFNNGWSHEIVQNIFFRRFATKKTSLHLSFSSPGGVVNQIWGGATNEGGIL